MRVYFGNKEIPDDDLFIANQQLAVVEVKLFGVIIRDDLKWDGQVENIAPKPTRNSSCCVNWKRLALAPRNLSQFTRVTWDLF